jgi:hypothetical protein
MAAGARRAVGSPVILVWLWLINLAVAAPAAWVVTVSVEDAIGGSRVHERLREGFDMEWYGEYTSGAYGVASTLTPSHAGAGAFYDNLEDLLTGGLFVSPLFVIVAGVCYALLWLLMLGGALDRYADRDTRPGIRRFFAAGGRFFFRLARLAVLSGVLYAAVYWLSRRMFAWMEEATRDVTVGSTIFYYSLLIWALTAVLLTLIHACFGFAKVAIVVEGRRSMLLAAVRGFVFVATHPARTLGLYYGFLLLSGLLLVVYAIVAPGVGQQTYETVIQAFAWGQLFLLLKLFLRLSLLGGQTALYQTHGLAPSPAPRADRGPRDVTDPSTTQLQGPEHHGVETAGGMSA